MGRDNVSELQSRFNLSTAYGSKLEAEYISRHQIEVETQRRREKMQLFGDL